MQWVLGKLEGTPERIADELVAAMPAELEQVFRERKLL